MDCVKFKLLPEVPDGQHCQCLSTFLVLEMRFSWSSRSCGRWLDKDFPLFNEKKISSSVFDTYLGLY